MFATGSGLAAFGGFLTLFLLLVGLLWLLIPFAVFGIKPLLKQLIAEQKRTNDALTRISQQINPIAVALVKAPKPAPQETVTSIEPAPVPEDSRTLSEIMADKRIT